MTSVVAASRYAGGGRPARVVAVAKASLGAAVGVSRRLGVGACSHELNVRSGNLIRLEIQRKTDQHGKHFI